MHTLFEITTADREDPDEMPHIYCGISSGSALFAKTKMIFREKTETLFRNQNL